MPVLFKISKTEKTQNLLWSVRLCLQKENNMNKAVWDNYEKHGTFSGVSINLMLTMFEVVVVIIFLYSVCKTMKDKLEIWT